MTDSNLNNENIEMFEGDEFVLTTNSEGNIVGGGYKIKSFFLQEGISPMTTLNTSGQQGGKVSSPFENLAVPAGLFYVNMRVAKKETEPQYKPHEMASDDIIDKLYALVEVDKKRKRKTRKHNSKNNKTNTRKHK